MFYSQFILAKKGPLGTIWIAAHLERKLRKNQVADTDIGVSVDSILAPDVPIALRLSSHLLLGVVRIYNRKVNYLFDDCSEALLKVKQAFRSTAVDLPPEQSKAPYHSITLPETFDLDDFELPDNDNFQGNLVDHHVSSRDQITLQDTMDGVTLSTSRFGLDERFGDADTSGVDLDEELFLDKVGTSSNVNVAPIKDDHHDAMTPHLEPMFDEVDEDDLMDDAQAPRTPGLLEEPNLSNAHETSACEDRFETEERHLTEAIMKEDLGKMSGEKNAHVDWSIPDMNSDTVMPMAPEVGHHFSDLDFKKPQDVAFEQKSLDNHASAFGTSSRVDNHAFSVSDLAELRPQEIFYNQKDNVDSNMSLGNNERSDGGHVEKSSNDFRLSANFNQQVLQNVPTSSTMEASQNMDNVDIGSQDKAENQTYKEPIALSMNNNWNLEEEYNFLVRCKANQGSNSEGNQSIDPKPCNENETSSSVQGNTTLGGSENVTLGDTTRDPPFNGLSHAAGGISFPVDNGKSIENLVENIYFPGSPAVLAPEKQSSASNVENIYFSGSPAVLAPEKQMPATSVENTYFSGSPAVLAPEKQMPVTNVGNMYFSGSPAVLAPEKQMPATNVENMYFSGSPAVLAPEKQMPATNVENMYFSGSPAVLAPEKQMPVTNVENMYFSGSPAVLAPEKQMPATSVGNTYFSGSPAVIPPEKQMPVTSAGDMYFSGSPAVLAPEKQMSTTNVENMYFSGSPAVHAPEKQISATNVENMYFSEKQRPATNVENMYFPGSPAMLAPEKQRPATNVENMYFPEKQRPATTVENMYFSGNPAMLAPEKQMSATNVENMYFSGNPAAPEKQRSVTNVENMYFSGNPSVLAPEKQRSVSNVGNMYFSGSPASLAPEKRRSVTNIADNHPGHLAMGYTPGGLARNVEGDAGSNFIYGKKRTYTESSQTEQSFYTVVSSGTSQNKRTVESSPDDEDFLSSILGGRNTSVFKVRPTPSPRVTSSVKRRRTVPNSVTPKRKILIDDSMVLHGDTIRKQLMNTEDIRRVRKKAPCTRPEVLIIQKQFLEDKMFIEPICTGLSTKLAALHNQTHYLGGIVVNVDDVVCASPELGTKGIQEHNNFNLNTEVVEGNTEVVEGSTAQEVMKESSKGEETQGLMVEGNTEVVEGNTEVVENYTAQEVMKESSKEEENQGLTVEGNPGQETIDAHPVLVDAQDGDCKSNLPDAVIESESNTIANAEENCSLLEPTDTELVERPASVTDVVNTTAAESSLLSELVSGDHVTISADLAQVATSADKFAGDHVAISADLAQVASSADKFSGDAQFPDINIICEDIPLHNDANMQRDEMADEVNLETASPHEIGKDFGNVTKEEVAPLTDEERLLDTTEGNATVETQEVAPLTDEERLLDTTEGNASVETQEERLLDTTEGNAAVETEEAWINNRGVDYTVDTMANKETEHMGSFPMDTNLHMEDVLFDGAKFSFEGGSDYPLNVDDMGSLDGDYADMSYSLADNETDFLNVDDDDDDYEAAEEADDHIPDKHATVTDNSGWSSRTRAVANYLQTLFVKQGGNTKGSLEMDNLLIGKTKKEASRMFFEALVLKTKDYVDVEQAHPFDNISVRPHTKLMKSQF